MTADFAQGDELEVAAGDGLGELDGLLVAIVLERAFGDGFAQFLVNGADINFVVLYATVGVAALPWQIGDGGDGQGLAEVNLEPVRMARPVV